MDAKCARRANRNAWNATSSKSATRKTKLFSALVRPSLAKFPPQKRTTILAVSFAPLAGFAKHFFVRDGPGDRGDWNRDDEQPEQLDRQRHSSSAGDQAGGKCAIE